MGDIQVTIYTDNDDFASMECPYCGMEFKLAAADINNDDAPVSELFCPYCGLANTPDRFVSREVIDAMIAKAHNYAAELINDMLLGMARQVNSKKGIIRMEVNPIETKPEKDVKEHDSVETIFHCNACEHRVKVFQSAGMSKIYCPYCGVDM